MKATDFQWIDPIQNNFPDAWRIQETIKSGRAIDKDFYPASKKGTDTHVTAMHAANLIFALSLKSSKASIERTLKIRYLLRSQTGSYFMNDLARYLTEPENFWPAIWRNVGDYSKAIKEVRISTDRPYVEVIYVNQDFVLPKDFDEETQNLNDLVEGYYKKDVYSSEKFEPQDAENFTILSASFLRDYSRELNHSFDQSKDKNLIRAHVKSFKKIQVV